MHIKTIPKNLRCELYSFQKTAKTAHGEILLTRVEQRASSRELAKQSA